MLVTAELDNVVLAVHLVQGFRAECRGLGVTCTASQFHRPFLLAASFLLFRVDPDRVIDHTL
jgi:hypothetical protein